MLTAKIQHEYKSYTLRLFKADEDFCVSVRSADYHHPFDREYVYKTYDEAAAKFTRIFRYNSGLVPTVPTCAEFLAAS